MYNYKNYCSFQGSTMAIETAKDADTKQELDRPGKIIVLGIPKQKNFTDADLEKHFSKFGRITESKHS